MDTLDVDVQPFVVFWAPILTNFSRLSSDGHSF
jgi:hypothetical protein